MRTLQFYIDFIMKFYLDLWKQTFLSGLSLPVKSIKNVINALVLFLIFFIFQNRFSFISFETALSLFSLRLVPFFNSTLSRHSFSFFLENISTIRFAQHLKFTLFHSFFLQFDRFRYQSLAAHFQSLVFHANHLALLSINTQE